MCNQDPKCIRMPWGFAFGGQPMRPSAAESSARRIATPVDI